jgi:hypothetical protein
MAGDQLSDIRQLVLDKMAALSSDPLFEASILDRTINATNKRLGREHDWSWLEVIDTIAFASAVNSFDLTTLDNFRHFKYLGYENQKLKTISAAEFVGYSAASNQYPIYYTTVKDTLYVAPTPSAAVTLDVVYICDENDLLDDGDRPLLPVPYTDLLVLKTCVALAVRAKDTAKLQMVKSEYKDALIEARDEVRRTRELPRITADESLWRMI